MTEILNQGKFDRIVELIVQRDGQAYAITNLLIDFRIQKFPGAVDNRGVIRIYNLRSNVRGHHQWWGRPESQFRRTE